MVIDLLIIIVVLIFGIFGYKKGFIIQLINLGAGILYMFFSTDLLMNTLMIFKQDELKHTLEQNATSQLIVITLIGLILFTLLNLLLKKIFKLKLLSFINRLGGILIGLVFAYLLICFINIVLNFLGIFITYDDYLQQSFFLSKEFKDYNIIEWWFNNG